MSVSHLYSLTDSDLTANANQVKDILLASLESEGKLKETAEKLSTDYIIVAVQPNWLGRFISKLAGKDADKVKYVVSKII